MFLLPQRSPRAIRMAEGSVFFALCLGAFVCAAQELPDEVNIATVVDISRPVVEWPDDKVFPFQFAYLWSDTAITPEPQLQWRKWDRDFPDTFPWANLVYGNDDGDFNYWIRGDTILVNFPFLAGFLRNETEFGYYKVDFRMRMVDPIDPDPVNPKRASEWSMAEAVVQLKRAFIAKVTAFKPVTRKVEANKRKDRK